MKRVLGLGLFLLRLACLLVYFNIDAPSPQHRRRGHTQETGYDERQVGTSPASLKPHRLFGILEFPLLLLLG